MKFMEKKWNIVAVHFEGQQPGIQGEEENNIFRQFRCPTTGQQEQRMRSRKVREIDGDD